MRIRVRFDPHCRFDIGRRTPETRSIVKQCTKAFAAYAAEYAGLPPGYRRACDTPPLYAWADANWEFVYQLERSRGILTVNILSVAVGSGGNRR
jgi:hypothetical protein